MMEGDEPKTKKSAEKRERVRIDDGLKLVDFGYQEQDRQAVPRKPKQETRGPLPSIESLPFTDPEIRPLLSLLLPLAQSKLNAGSADQGNSQRIAEQLEKIHRIVD